ncbi:dihydrolipoamide dehydrogenase [Bordetella trematum]|uniref:Dihydrolipoamide dehydrogenase n=1 Tax=Bordetella trematum TaxID=123899 RepID=A0A157SSU7_9BORD|nr:dihydrolipoamide dehydrogenase [Bordetella trematum]
MSNLKQIKVPDIGDFKEVEVIEVLVAVGDTIAAEQSLITVESDKASMEIPASEGGVVKAVNVKVGDKVAEGSVIVEVEAAAGAPAAQAAPAAPAKPAARQLRPRRPQPLLRPPMAARPTWSATCWSWAPAPAVIRPPSGPPIWACRPCWSSATPPWAAYA